VTADSAPDPRLDAADQELAARLQRERPVPAADFRGALGRRLAASDPGYGPRPDRLRTMVTASLAAGLGVSGFGALQALGVL
jgi:hypothetical protein